MSIYNYFKNKKATEGKPLGTELEKVINDTTKLLISRPTDVKHPGLLLGKIQSGKTNAFIGVIAKGFDDGYDVMVLFTKSSIALVQQTIRRVENELSEPVENGQINILDIIHLPNRLQGGVLRKKLIFLAKKEKGNLKALHNVFFNEYNDYLKDRNVLIIDDEADFTGVGYKSDDKKADGFDLGVISKEMSLFRSKLSGKSDFLQVTATAYSLYLQPENIKLNNETYEPLKPAFTQLVPVHRYYIGGEYYFEYSKVPDTAAYYLHNLIEDNELIKVLNNKKRDKRYISNILTTDNAQGFRTAIINYLVAGSVRLIQESKNNKYHKSSFIVHTHTSIAQMKYQVELVESLIFGLINLHKTDKTRFIELIQESYDNLLPSLQTKDNYIPSDYKGTDRKPTYSKLYIPSFKEVCDELLIHLRDENIAVIELNSDNPDPNLLNKDGQFKLMLPFNIFIGGGKLDRGVTFDNLLGFFYGRESRTYQQDTVLQHSRMYGARSHVDMKVTRFYTTALIYESMQKMYEFDEALREQIIKNPKEPIKFINKDPDGNFRPCSPLKILISNTTTLKEHKRLLPVGLQTKSPTETKKITDKVEAELRAITNDIEKPFKIKLDKAIELLNLIYKSYEFSDRFNNEELDWDIKAIESTLKYINEDLKNPAVKNNVFCFARLDRKTSRIRPKAKTFSDAPDDGQKDAPEARKAAKDAPCIVFIKQKGLAINGWRDVEFWWPVIYCPENMTSTIFTSKSVD